MNKLNLLSGIAPSGKLTLGNYLGALRNWTERQDEYHCFFPLVDLHAITVRQDPVAFTNLCRDFVALYLACGIDPEKSVVFCQSHVPEHCQLSWILQCYTQIGELNRMTQFKGKSRSNKGDINAGLFSYPALMAADILLYKTDLVPVGEDQRQHLELTRDVAGRFNNLYGDLFRIPEAYIPNTGGRIMSLQDPTKKMSKSDAVDANIIGLLDEPAVITRKLKRCVTDSGNEIVVSGDKPGISNLLNILAAITETTTASLEEEYSGLGYGRLKADVADAVVAVVEPIQSRFNQLRSNDRELDELLAVGAGKAQLAAQLTIKEVHNRLGFIAKLD